MPNSGLLRGEIKDVVINQSNAQITFRNGSYIEVVTANDNSRGHRANLLVCDEFRMINKDVIDLVLKKFLTVARQPVLWEHPPVNRQTHSNIIGINLYI